MKLAGCGFDLQQGHTKDYNNGTIAFRLGTQYLGLDRPVIPEMLLTAPSVDGSKVKWGG